MSVLATAVAANRGFLPNKQKPTPTGRSGRRGCQNPHFHKMTRQVTSKGYLFEKGFQTFPKGPFLHLVP